MSDRQKRLEKRNEKKDPANWSIEELISTQKDEENRSRNSSIENLSIE
jgi:hypothetical protein